ncbi:Uma2 family endonuclease [Deinococcus aluminii]|uniref:Uma2 family endonuclease n=1 Tax=Deinococcus aluminii TaxID=1656885 RepID=UPI0031E612D0
MGGFWYGLHGESAEEDGTSAAHNLIMGNVLGTLHLACLRLGYRLFSSQFKLHLLQQAAFYYPDVMACPGEPKHDFYATAPCLLVEILSERSEWIDRHAKYCAYTALPTLQTYLIVEQDERRVYAYQREGGKWALTELVGQGSLPLRCLGRTLTLDEIYAGVL